MEMDKERTNWLLNMTECESRSLNRVDWYDRIRLLRQKEGAQHVFDRPPHAPVATPYRKKAHRRNFGTVIYRDFGSD